MRTRTRLLVSFVAVQVVLALLGGWLVWRWLDNAMREQAIHRAQSVGEVLAQGGFALNDTVLSRMQELTGHQFRILDAPEPVRDGTVQVPVRDSSGTRTIEIDYRTDDYRAVSHAVLLGTLVAVFGGAFAFSLVALWLSTTFARPLERLAAAARTMGGGDLERAVPAVGGGEVLELARELESTRERLRDLDRQHTQAERLRTLGTFTATIAHEVRNPLSAVRITVQMLAKRLPHDASLTLIIDELERLDLIVDELLAFSKGMTVTPVRCDLRGAVDSAVRLLKRQADHAGVTLTVTGSATVTADPARLRQLLINLVLNAIQAQHGGGEVRVGIFADGLTVADDGPGIDAALRPHLFEAFASARPGGTGLGLHLAKTIADAHGATLELAPSERGTCFRLSGLAAPV